MGIATAGVVAVASPASATPTTGYEVLLKGGNGTLWTVDPSGTVTDTGHAMRSDNSPAIAGLSTGGFKGVFVASDNTLWSATSSGGSPTFSQVRTVGGAFSLGPGGNAAVAADAHGGWQMSFLSGGLPAFINSANPNSSSVSSIRMLNKTPSVVALPSGGFSTAFIDVLADPDVDLPKIREAFSQGGDDGFTAGVDTSTTPSIAANGSVIKIAYSSFFGNLVYIDAGTRTSTNSFPVKAGTSPAIVAGNSGSFVTAFVNSSGNIEVDDAGFTLNPGVAVAPGTNPAIAPSGAADGSWKVAFADSNNHLTFMDQNDQIVHTSTVIAAGTSPAIARVTTTTPPPPPSTATLTLNEQATVNGFIPFSGAFPPFGSTQPGKLLSFTYPASGFLDSSLLFLKSGHSTAECGDPNAVVVLNEGQTTTSAQLTAIYGTATPSFSTTTPLTAVACFSGPTPTPSFINLQMSVQFNS